jgi:hypothetical protein
MFTGLVVRQLVQTHLAQMLRSGADLVKPDAVRNREAIDAPLLPLHRVVQRAKVRSTQ